MLPSKNESSSFSQNYAKSLKVSLIRAGCETGFCGGFLVVLVLRPENFFVPIILSTSLVYRSPCLEDRSPRSPVTYSCTSSDRYGDLLCMILFIVIQIWLSDLFCLCDVVFPLLLYIFFVIFFFIVRRFLSNKE